MKLFARGDPGSVNRCVDAGGDAPADQRAGGLERPARDDAQRIAGIRVDDDPDVTGLVPRGHQQVPSWQSKASRIAVRVESDRPRRHS